MSKEKQIEEMAEITKDHCVIENQCGSCHWETCNECFAEFLYEKGYRKQSENAVELPCKVGDTIYLPWKFDGVKSIACLTVTHIIFDREHNYVKTDFNTDDEAYYDKYKCGSYEFEDFGEIVFLTHEEAEKALAKMKGGE